MTPGERQAVVDEVLDALRLQGFLLIDRDGNCFARQWDDTERDHTVLIRDVRHSPVATPTPKETP